MGIPAYLLPHTVTIITVAETGPDDRYGNPTEVETSTPGVKAYVQPTGSKEDIVNRDTRISTFDVFLEASVSVTGLSKIVWEGITLRVAGEPSRFDTPSGQHHYELVAERIDG